MRGNKKTIFNSTILFVAVFLVFVPFISSNSAGCCLGSDCYTVVEGEVYYADTLQPAAGATVDVLCEDHTGVRRDSTEETETLGDGTYYVIFCNTECEEDDLVTVTATDKNGLTGENNGIPQDYGDINIALVNVPLVPEFGIFAGVITIISALGVFFIVRRK